MSKIFRSLHNAEITEEQARGFMTGEEARDELFNLFNKEIIPHGYYGILD